MSTLFSPFRSKITTFVPSWRKRSTIAAPMPAAPPVTIAVFPLSPLMALQSAVALSFGHPRGIGILVPARGGLRHAREPFIDQAHVLAFLLGHLGGGGAHLLRRLAGGDALEMFLRALLALQRELQRMVGLHQVMRSEERRG